MTAPLTRRGGTFVALVALVALFSAPTGAPVQAASPDLVTAPVTLVQGTVGYTPVVTIRVNNSAPLTVLLDSGSSGLVLNTPDVPASVLSGLTDLHASVAQDYTSGDVTGGLYSGQMSLLNASGATLGTWTTPLMVGQCAQAGCGWPRSGIQGVLGIASGVHSVAGPSGAILFASPFTTDASVTGVAFHFDSATMTGTFAIGSTEGAPGTTLQAPSEGTSYANGLPAFHHYVSGCWIIASVTSCSAYTTFDSGAPLGFISSTDFASLFAANEALPDGTEISFSAAAGTAPFGSLTIGRPNEELHYLPGQRSNPVSNNSGAGFLLDRDIAIDYSQGTVTIGDPGVTAMVQPTPTASPSASARNTVVITVLSPVWWGLVGGIVLVVLMIGLVGFWLRKTR